MQTARHRLGTIDLSGCMLYATCEPCLMCFTAAHWVRISRIVFGVRIHDFPRAGFNELTIPACVMKERGNDALEVVGDVLRPEAVALFDLWALRGNRATY